MGYRSNLAVRIYSDVNDTKNLMGTFGETYNSVFEFYLDDDTQMRVMELEIASNNITGNSDVFFNSEEYGTEFLFVANNVKWYETDSAVQFFQRIIGEAQALDLNVEYIIIGEDTTDIEVLQEGPSCQYRLGLIRNIDFG